MRALHLIFHLKCKRLMIIRFLNEEVVLIDAQSYRLVDFSGLHLLDFKDGLFAAKLIVE